MAMPQIRPTRGFIFIQLAEFLKVEMKTVVFLKLYLFVIITFWIGFLRFSF